MTYENEFGMNRAYLNRSYSNPNTNLVDLVANPRGANQIQVKISV